MKMLTKKQKEIYEFIIKSKMNNGYPPTQKEIRDHFEYRSTTAVRNHLELIKKKGYIHLNYGKARGIQLPSSITTKQHGEETIPLLGHIAAGVPIWSEHNIEDMLPISPTLFGGGNLFAVHVHGESMIDSGIFNGDIAIISHDSHVDNGDIAAVLIEQEATLKHYYLTPESLLLKSANPKFHDLVFEPGQKDLIKILGRYRGIIRTGKHR